MDLTSEKPAIIEFGHFRVVPHRRELLADGQPIHLGGRTFDMLMDRGARGCRRQRYAYGTSLAEPDCRGEQPALPDLGLRDALGAERSLIRTISGRGYQFTGEIRTVAASPHAQVITDT